MLEDKKYFNIPTKEQLRNRCNINILESTDGELYELYNEVYTMSVLYRDLDELECKKDMELIKKELERRNLKIPGTLYDLSIYPFKEQLVKIIVFGVTILVLLLVFNMLSY